MGHYTEPIFRAALSDFKSRLKPEERQEVQFATFEDVQKDIVQIQREQESSKTMANIARIRPFLEAMDQLGQIIEVFLNCSEFIAFIWGPIKLVLKVMSAHADAFETLLEAYQQIGEHMPLLKQYEELFHHSPHMQAVLSLIYIDILEFHRYSVRRLKDTTWRQLFHAVWKDFKARFQNILDRLLRHRELIERQASLIHYKESQESIQEVLSLMHQHQSDIQGMKTKHDEAERLESQRQRAITLTWLAGAKTESEHQALREIRCTSPASGAWILTHEKIENWIEGEPPSSSCGWLNGIPGAGKTVLASVIIDGCMTFTKEPSIEDEYLIEQSPEKIPQPRARTAYFYCKESDPERNTFIALLKGLLSQQITHHRALMPFFHDKYLSSRESSLSSVALAKQLFELVCKTVPRQYVIIDGLDECDSSERKLILSFFTDLVEKFDKETPGKLRVLFISQEYSDIKSCLGKANIIPLTPSDNENDIRMYVNKWALEIQLKFELDTPQVEFIEASTVGRAHGMFLFARLVMPNLYDQPNREELLNEIKTSTFPDRLQQAYERIMCRIEKMVSRKQLLIVQKLIGWLGCAKRPLKWQEIQVAMSIDVQKQTIEYSNLRLRVHVADLCGSLVQIKPGDRVELVHSTAKIHLINSGFLQELTVESNLTALCLHYLTFECFELEITAERLTELALEGYFVFQDYAVAKWFNHLLAMISSSHVLGEGNDGALNSLDDLKLALKNFADCYEEDLLQTPAITEEGKSCEAFEHLAVYESFLQVQNHVLAHQRKDFNERNKVSLKALETAFERNRKFIEELCSSEARPEQQIELRALYGDTVYKCSKLSCFYFHEGFKDAKTRDKHINKHDRPFHCTFPDCSYADFGFPSNRELEKHRKDYHAEVADLEEVFKSPSKAPTTSQHHCELCNKYFTRGFHLRNHLRTHDGTKPFACRECGKAFTRKNDCTRHEKIHARR